MTDTAQSDSKSPEGTAAALIAAALRLFGQQGFAATSTRQIASAAGTNVASIAYHFGGKDGLRRACGEEAARRLGALILTADPAPPATPGAAVAQMEAILRRMAAFIVGSRGGDDFVPFMLREVSEQGPELDAVYQALILPAHAHVCALWSVATGQAAESERTRLLVFSLLGQLVYFRIGRPVVERRLGWRGLGPEEAARITDILIGNLHAILARERRS